MPETYDLAVIGSGPSGQHAAIQAAKLGKRVVVIEKSDVVGGAAINTGTIPSKALREAVLYLTGATKRGFFGRTHRVKREITIPDLQAVTQTVKTNVLQTAQDQFDRNGIELLWGAARFEGPHTLAVSHARASQSLEAEKIIIAVGTRSAKPDHVPFNDRTIVTSDCLQDVGRIPRSLIVVGGGVIGTEFATMLQVLGVHVTLIEGGDQLLGFVDREIVESLQHAMRRLGVMLRLGERVASISEVETRGERRVQATLESGKQVRAETLLYCVGRQGVCKDLNLECVGLDYDDRERLEVNESFQTKIEHIYAVGDVIGFPALASTGMDQGRLAACHAFGVPASWDPHLIPFGIYSIPELAMVGHTEEELTKDAIPYETGVANYTEVARAQLTGDDAGMLKLLVHQENRKLLAVHCIGSGATELIHIGQMIMAYGGTVDDITHHVYNYPTFAEAYKIAAHSAINRLQLL